jgi:SAM-dependent methyltransferase
MRCHVCSHAYCCPIPEHIGDNYRDVVDEEYLKHATSRKLAAEAVIAVIYRLVQSGRLLDVGCATGDLLEAARDRQYLAEGLELSEWSSQIAAGKGFIIYKEYLASLAERLPNHFDVITLMGVIEHFAEPAEEMNSICKLLKPNGIVVIWTGDVNSITSRALGRKWWYWQGQHIQYFTHASLKRLVGLCGLSHLKTNIYPFVATFETISNSLRRYRSHRTLRQLIRPLFGLKQVWYIRLPGEMLFIAKKPPCPGINSGG